MDTFKIKISIINPDYDPEYEKEWGFLNRQYENLKYNSEVVYGIDDLKEYRYKDNISVELPYDSDDQNKTCIFENVCVLELIKEDESTSKFIISKSLISSTRELHREKYESGYFYFYLLPNIDYEKLSEGIYITSNELPAELRNNINYLEKILFIDITCKQYSKLDTEHPEFIATYQNLTEEEKLLYPKLKKQIHDAWTYINMPKIVPTRSGVNSIFNYHEVIQPIDDKIIKLCNDFGITLKEDISEEYKIFARKVFGEDYFKWFDE